jgi:hypothetical protein
MNKSSKKRKKAKKRKHGSGEPDGSFSNDSDSVDSKDSNTDDDRGTDIEYVEISVQVTTNTMTKAVSENCTNSQKTVCGCKSASNRNLQHNQGRYKTKKRNFRDWIRTLRDIFLYQPRLYFLLCNYPTIGTSSYKTTSCMALA